MYVVLEAGIA